ncbi:hypothetical protein BDZ45DRAFT_713284 [Acephala macrosclerotiorum]|nr:hypothetical protein BDZ45DRAFT_713284 [Acephala macrosclerotiorum]
MMSAFFNLPIELILNALCSRFLCRDQQIRSLATLLSIRSAPCRNIALHGLEATGKSSITKAVLEGLSKKQTNGQVNGNTRHDDDIRYAVIKSAECLGGRHLFEQTIGAVATAIDWPESVGRCENLAQLVVELSKLVEGYTRSSQNGTQQKLVLVFDGIDHQRDAPPTLLPALARLAEIIPNLTTIFIVTSPRPNFLHLPGVPHIEFPVYTKPELIQIVSLTDPSPPLPQGTKETKEVWTRYCSAIWDSLSKHSGRDILSFRSVCLRLWPRFIRPILDGSLNPSPFSRLLVANRSLFQNDSVLVPALVSNPPQSSSLVPPTQQNNLQGIAAQLPHISRLLLVASYLASYNPPRTDTTFFMKAALAKRRKKGGGTALSRKPGTAKSRKIARKLLGPQAFVLERMLAIFYAIGEDADSLPSQGKKKRKGLGNLRGSADVLMAVATLASLRLLVRMGGPNQDVLDAATKYRVAIGWEVVRGVARSVGVEVEDYLAD